jgi:hypothetical protein
VTLVPQSTRAGGGPPRAAAIAGIVFSVLPITSLTLVCLALPEDPCDPGVWLSGWGRTVALALNLLPFAGIAFLACRFC